jgi:hypothetical protein
MGRIIIALLVLTVVVTVLSFKQGAPETWRKDQLIEPADLVKLINSPGQQPTIFSIGFGAGIKNSIVMGPASDSANLQKWKMQLKNLPKDANIVVYCGCCPFVHCPNVRPAFKLLNDLQFTNAKLLDLSHNLKADWIDKGYPVESKP